MTLGLTALAKLVAWWAAAMLLTALAGGAAFAAAVVILMAVAWLLLAVFATAAGIIADGIVKLRRELRRK